MATIKTVLSLTDKMTPTLTKSQKQAIANLRAYQSLDKQLQELNKSEEMLAKSGLYNTQIYKDVETATSNVITEMENYQNGTQQATIENDNLKQSMTETNQALEVLNKAWSTLNGIIQESNEWMEASNNQFNAEFGSATKLHNVLGATEDEINSMYQYASALQEVGIVGDEATLAGAETLSMYVDNYEQLQQLTPLVDDLAVYMNKLDTSQSDVVSSASMIGKALQGSASMLKRQGVLTDAQADYIDSLNTVEEKSIALQKIFNNSIKGTNETLAQTSQGGIIQAKNSLGDLQEQLGTKVIPYYEMFENILVDILTPITNFVTANSDWLIPSIMAVMGGIALLIGVLTAYQVIGWLTAGVNWAMAAPLLIIVGLFVSFVIAVNLAAKALSNWSGQSVSAVGLVLGAVNVLKTGVENAFIDMYNGVQAMINGIAVIFIGLESTVIGVLDAIAQAIDFVFGSNLQATTSAWLDNAADQARAIAENPGYKERVSYSDAFQSGYDTGSTLFEGVDINEATTGDLSKWLDSMNSLVGTDSTGAAALKTTSNDNLLSDDDVQLLLDVATRDYQLSYQSVTPNITVSFGDVRETADVDSVLDAVGTRIEEIINGDAEIKD
jgi:hypothetical protein